MSIEQHMRPVDIEAFQQAARQFTAIILVRRLNPASLPYIGRPGYIPKSIYCQACRYLVIDFGTSKSPKSTHQRDNHYCPGRPASVPLRHTFVNSALATQHSLK